MPRHIEMRRQPTVLRAASLVTASVLLLATSAIAKDVTTSCADVCTTYTATLCVVTAVRDVLGGSNVDCSTARDIVIDGGELRVHDSWFFLRGKSLTLLNGGKITADCPQSFEPIGFGVYVTAGMTMAAGSQAKLSARCEKRGGRVEVEAGGDVIVDALGIDANGTAADASGGYVRLDAAGDVTLFADVSAEATGGTAHGGTIVVRAGDDLGVHGELRVKGYGDTSQERLGGDIALEARGDVLVPSGGGLDATSAQGGGGTVVISAGALADIARPVKARGTSGSNGAGGTVEIFGDTVRVNSDVTVAGGRQGGAIELVSRGGGVSIGTSAVATFDASGNAGDLAGRIAVVARGGSVTIGNNAVLQAVGNSGGSGGTVELRGTGVTTNGATQVDASGGGFDRPGTVDVITSGQLTLTGTMSGAKTFFYRAGTPSISGSITGYELIQDVSLQSPCGDGVRDVANEQCDTYDLGGHTCLSQGHGSGTLACDAACAFDYSGCSS
jgi:hypothetical protein